MIASILMDEKRPASLRLAAANDLLDRVYGRPPVAIDATTREPSLKKVIHEVRWLPPDPNDTSKVIERSPINATARPYFHFVMTIVSCSTLDALRSPRIFDLNFRDCLPGPSRGFRKGRRRGTESISFSMWCPWPAPNSAIKGLI